MALLRLLLLLTPVTCVPPTDQDLKPPIANLRVDLRKKQLTWDLNVNVSEVECYIDSTQMESQERYCEVLVLPKCQPSNYTIKVLVAGGGSFSTWVQHPRPEGNRGAAAEQIQCQVHDLDSLTCAWAVGREAPDDVQYEFFLENVGTGKTWACPRYTATELGTHVRCDFDGLSALLGPGDGPYYFRVTGSSRRARVPCCEDILYLSSIEQLVAPNLTVQCNRSVAVMEWDMFSHFQNINFYTLNITKNSEPQFTMQIKNQKSWTLINPGTFTVSIQAQDYDDRGGRWSVPQHFACDLEEGGHLPAWVIVSLVVLLAVGTAALLCKRFSLLKKLCPPIPRLTDPLGDFPDDLEHRAMAAGNGSPPTQEDCLVEEVQVLRDT